VCDFSLQAYKSRPAKVADKLVTKNFGSGTTGFCAEGEEDCAVCVLPGTEIAFVEPPKFGWSSVFGQFKAEVTSQTAVFRQVRKDEPNCHHDALEFPDGSVKLLTALAVGQKARVLQMPAAPKTEQEAKDQTRLEVVG
jgi:hypothetical protein